MIYGYRSANIVRMIKSRILGWAGPVARMEEGRSAFKLLKGTKKYNVFAPMGRFQLEIIYLHFPPSSHLVYVCFCPVGLSLL